MHVLLIEDGDVWGETNRITPLDNVIDVLMAHLRRKVDEGHPTRLCIGSAKASTSFDA